MKRIKDLDLKIVYELIKNSRTSDRELAKTLGVSQPTITRRRAKIEKEMIDGYTAIPKWEKLGYQLLAIILLDGQASIPIDKHRDGMRKAWNWIMKHPNIIMQASGEGIGANAFMITIHKNYGEYDDFMSTLRREIGSLLGNVQTFLVNLTAKERLKPLHLKYLAEAE